MSEAVFFYTEGFQGYDMGPEHPLQPIRLRRTFELLQAYGALPEGSVQEPQPCSVDDLLTTHSMEYVEAVNLLSVGESPAFNRSFGYRHNYGFGMGDNPVFHGMFEASRLYTGASVDAAQAVLDGRAPVALNISGGLHHAHYARAAGFCIFNDCAAAIHRLRRKFDRVAYVDIDVHHGDGVQEAFYSDPSVLTISIHESGRTLFPGTGFVAEIGEGDGRGYSVNVPVWSSTPDAVWLRAFREAAMPILRAFDPQAIVLQTGADAHFLDPLAHVALTAQGWLEAVRDVKALNRPTVVLGGGGYNPTTVPRMWALAYGVMTDAELPEETPESYAFHSRIPRLRDAQEPPVGARELAEAEHFASQTVEEVRRTLFPMHGL